MNNCSPRENRGARLRPAATVISAPKGPGTDLGNETRACASRGYESLPGAVQDGMRKVVTKSPFGDVCRWEPVK